MKFTRHVSARNLLLRGLIAGVCAPFLVSGIAKLCDLAQTSQELTEIGVGHPGAGVLVMVFVQMVGSRLAIFCRGAWAIFGALALARLAVFANLLGHSSWTIHATSRTAQFNVLAEHVSIVFAMLMVAQGHATAMVMALRQRKFVRSARHTEVSRQRSAGPDAGI